MEKVLKALKNKRFWAVAAVLLAIIFLGNSLRWFSYASVPHPGETADEYVFAWAGLGLIKEGKPVGWTGVEGAYRSYDYQKINVDSLYDREPARLPFSIVAPWFDKPPGFALLIGGYSYLKGARDFAQTGVAIIRRPMVRIAILTTILVFILASRFYGPGVGLLSALFYSTIPTMIVSSRLVLAENGYIPLFLTAVILADLYLEKKRDIFWISAAALAAAGTLFKLSAIAILLSLLLIFALYVPKRKKAKVMIGTLLIGISGLALFFLYGFFLDWETFVKIFFAQANLFYGASSEAFFSALTHSKVTADKFLTDGWITLGWIALLTLLFFEWKKKREGTILGLSVFSYLIVFLFFGSEAYGWYRFPFFPFLAIAIAWLFQRLLLAPNLLVFFPLALLPFGTTVHRILGLEGFQSYVPTFRIFLILTLAIVALSLLPTMKVWSKRIQQAFIILVIGFLIFLSIKQILFFTYDKWFFVT